MSLLKKIPSNTLKAATAAVLGGTCVRKLMYRYENDLRSFDR